MYSYKGNYWVALKASSASYKIERAHNFAGAELFYYLSIADLLNFFSRRFNSNGGLRQKQ